MRRFAVPAVTATLAVVLLIVLAVAISNQGANNSIAYAVASHHYREAPDSATPLPVLSGTSAVGGAKSVRLTDLRGKVVLVNLFASWCVACQAEAPVLAHAEKLLAAHGGMVLGVTYQNSPSAALGFVHQYHVDYPVVEDPSGNLATALNVTNGVPDTFVVNREGKIVALNLYQLTTGWVNQTLPKLLAQS